MSLGIIISFIFHAFILLIMIIDNLMNDKPFGMIELYFAIATQLWAAAAITG